MKIPEEAYPLLDGKNFAHVTTLLPDGTPQTTVVWVEREHDTVLFNTAKGRVKYNNIRRDPRVTLSVHDQNNPYKYVQIRGRAEVVEEGADAHAHKLSHKYFGRDYSNLETDPPRVIVRIMPEQVYYFNFQE
jgi:PPOX class probable F420-dependent enzyme